MTRIGRNGNTCQLSLQHAFGRNVNTNGNYNNNNASNSNGIRPALMESEISNPSDGTNTVHHHQRESYPVARLCMDGR